jgi:hypothetical protein
MSGDGLGEDSGEGEGDVLGDGEGSDSGDGEAVGAPTGCLHPSLHVFIAWLHTAGFALAAFRHI